MQKVLTLSSALSLEPSAFCSQEFVMLPQGLPPPGAEAQGREKHKSPGGSLLMNLLLLLLLHLICQAPADFLILCQREVDDSCSLELKI